jgi:hypothetical protein
MAEITYEEFDKTVAVDLKGVWNCMKFEIEQMLKQEEKDGVKGCIVIPPLKEVLQDFQDKPPIFHVNMRLSV